MPVLGILMCFGAFIGSPVAEVETLTHAGAVFAFTRRDVR